MCAIQSSLYVVLFFFFNDTATTEIYTLSLHDALPISGARRGRLGCRDRGLEAARVPRGELQHAHFILRPALRERSEEHTSELQSPCNLVCRLLLEKKKTPTRAVRTSLDRDPACSFADT